MANSDLYRKMKNDPNQITWKDIFSDFRKKHTRQDFEQAMLIGTPAMMHGGKSTGHWKKPWLFYPALKICLLVYLLIYGMTYLLIQTYGYIGFVGINIFVIIVPPLILPIVLMIFFWELNIPANISLVRMFIYFVIGGFLSLTINMLIRYDFNIPSIASYAPFAEEPAKLLVSLLFLWLFTREHPGWRIYGLTGLAIGAAVGAGFGGFESVQYGIKEGTTIHTELFQSINLSGFNFLIGNHLGRGIWAVAGHTLFCAPYTAAAALHMQRGKFSKEMFLNDDFEKTFAVSFISHAVWNTYGNFWIYLIITGVLWANTLYITRKCFAQVAGFSGGAVSYPAGDVYPLSGGGTYPPSVVLHYVVGVSGYSAGNRIPLNGTIHIGRGEDCQIRFPGDYRGVSRNHCRLELKNSKIYLIDNGSTYGTFLDGNHRIQPNVYYEVKPGSRIYIGSQREQLQIM